MKPPSRRAPPRKRKPAKAQFLIPTGVYTETPPPPPPARWRGLAAVLCLLPIFGGIWLIAPPAKPPATAYAVSEQRPAMVMQPVASVQDATPVPAPAPPPPPPPPSAPETLYVTGKRVPMRDAAVAGAPILDRLAPGQSVKALERRGDWVKVRHDLTQREGWMQAKRLTASLPQVEETKPEPPKKASPALSTAAITKLLIAAPLESYPSSCPCPYNTDRGGRSCGRRSAYSRPGGYAPLCYASDITPEMVAEYRASH